jgi:alpha-galactosidase
LIKLDYITPGSPDNGGHLPLDNSGVVKAYHNAIKSQGVKMRLDISWKLDRTSSFFPVWLDNADSMRTDQDINNSGQSTLVNWGTVQRAIDNYRDFVVKFQALDRDKITTHPDMDNLLIGASSDGLTDQQRQTVMTHWIGAAANLIIGSDVLNLDSVATNLFTNSEAMAVADFTAKYPMQPRNPGSGGQDAKQLQAWTAGPNENGEVVVVLANYGPDQGNGGFGTNDSGTKTVKATFDDLGIQGSFNVRDIWNAKDSTAASDIQADLAEGESRLFLLKPANARRWRA